MFSSVVSGLISSFAAPTPPASEPALELPKITVTDHRPLPPPESWRYAKIPGIEILSGASDRETQKLLRDFQLFNTAIGVVWPALKTHRPLPMTFILCGPGKFDAFKPTDDRKIDAGKASVLLRSPEQAAIVLNFAAKIIDLVPSQSDVIVAPPSGQVTSDDPSTATDDPSATRATMQMDYYRQLYHEYVRYLLSFNQPRLPAWLEEGLAQLLMGMRVEPKYIEFAKLEDPNLKDLPGDGQRDYDFNRTLAQGGLMAMEEFFAVTRDSPEATNQFSSRWAKQAQGLVHMWLYGEGRRYNKGFAQFVARSGREPVTEAMFKECFGMGYKDMLTAFRIYARDTAYQHQEFNARKGGGIPEPASLELRDATQAEVARIKGEAETLAGHADAAHDELLAAYIRGTIDAPLLAALGLNEKARGENGRARKFLEAAAKQNVVRPRAYLELANLRLADAQHVPSGIAPTPLSADQTKSVLQPLLIARQQPPPMAEVYELMADVWLHSVVAPAKPDLAAINQGVLIFQRRPLLLLHAAELNGKYGDPAEARTMAEFGIKLSRTPDARQAFEDVLASLPPAPAKK